MRFTQAITGLTLLCCSALAADQGFAGTLSSLDSGLGGTVEVVDDKTLMISDYTLEDASAPALYWWGSTTDDLPSGFRISNEQITEAAPSDSLTIKLDAGKTAKDFSVVGLWCEKLSANFGQATLTADGASSSSASSDDKDSAAVLFAGGKQATIAALTSLMAFAYLL